jgi:hypothetical protein
VAAGHSFFCGNYLLCIKSYKAAATPPVILFRKLNRDEKNNDPAAGCTHNGNGTAKN